MTRPEFSAIIARLIPRIETELARLGLDDATIRGVTPHIVRKVRALGIDSTSAADRFLAPDSSFFRFWEKIEKVAGHYDSYGLTHAAYLKALRGHVPRTRLTTEQPMLTTLAAR